MYREERNGHYSRKKTASESSISELDFNVGECSNVNCGHTEGKSGAASVNGVAQRHRKTSRTKSATCDHRQRCKFGFHLAVPMGKRTPGNEVGLFFKQ